MSVKLPYRLTHAARGKGDVLLRFAASVSSAQDHFILLLDEDFAELMDLLRALAPASDEASAAPSEDNEIDAVVSAPAALTDRVRALEGRAEPKAASPFSFGDDGKLYVSPAVIPKMRAAEQSAAAASVVDIDKADIAEGPDWTATHDFASGETRFESRPADQPAPSTSKLYDEATRITTEPADGLPARLTALETAVASLQTSVAALSDDVSHISASEGGLDCRLVTLEGQLAGLQAGVDGLKAATTELRGRRS